jgi:phospho-N-acetylmuramoyl-pentapeptide-transferase
VLAWIGNYLTQFFGPFRLLTSYLFRAGLGAALGAILTFFVLPRLWHRLPTDQGREYAVGAARSKGKPVAAGVLFVPIFCFICFLVMPVNLRYLAALGLVLLSMLEGYLDDRSHGGWSELKLGAFDLVISLLGAVVVCQLQDVQIWLPLIKEPLTLSPWLYVPFATGLLWLMINATNCTDGVDGLSGSLTLLGLAYLGVMLYGVVGRRDVSSYLLVPHYPDGADWALMAFVMVGCLGGYLWHNANPSAVLMGDAGSRPMGLLTGLLVLASGNPFLVVVVAGVVIVNGATGLLKLALLRLFKIGIFKSVRYPLHDHVRHSDGWSNTQVMVRFVLLQAAITPLLLIFLLKVR